MHICHHSFIDNTEINNTFYIIYYRTQANYVMWRAAASSLRYLNSAIRKYRYYDLRTFSLGDILSNHRWYECAEVVIYSRSA